MAEPEILATTPRIEKIPAPIMAPTPMLRAADSPILGFFVESAIERHLLGRSGSGPCGERPAADRGVRVRLRSGRRNGVVAVCVIAWAQEFQSGIGVSQRPPDREDREAEPAQQQGDPDNDPKQRDLIGHVARV